MGDDFAFVATGHLHDSHCWNRRPHPDLAIKEEEFPEIDAHGKNVVNWIVSGTVLYFICIPLIFVFGLGLVLMLALMIAHIVFGIIGGLKANDGILWPYPMTFIKIF